MFWKSFLVAFLLDNKRRFISPPNKRNFVMEQKTSVNNELINNLWKPNAIFSDGRDHTINETLNQTLLIKIAENYKKKDLLTILESPRLSNITKLLYIDEYNTIEQSKIQTINIKAGGLFKDWDNI